MLLNQVKKLKLKYNKLQSVYNKHKQEEIKLESQSDCEDTIIEEPELKDESNEQLSEEVYGLQAVISRLQEENSSLMLALRNQSKTAEELSADLHPELRSEISRLKSENHTLIFQHEALVIDNQYLRLQITKNLPELEDRITIGTPEVLTSLFEVPTSVQSNKLTFQDRFAHLATPPSASSSPKASVSLNLKSEISPKSVSSSFHHSPNRNLNPTTTAHKHFKTSPSPHFSRRTSPEKSPVVSQPDTLMTLSPAPSTPIVSTYSLESSDPLRFSPIPLPNNHSNLKSSRSKEGFHRNYEHNQFPIPFDIRSPAHSSPSNNISSLRNSKINSIGSPANNNKSFREEVENCKRRLTVNSTPSTSSTNLTITALEKYLEEHKRQKHLQLSVLHNKKNSSLNDSAKDRLFEMKNELRDLEYSKSKESIEFDKSRNEALAIAARAGLATRNHLKSLT